jgi:3-oxoacyl-[acyl-carrier protein] reductase
MVKLGIVGFTRGLAREFGPYGITANCVGPGYIARASDTAETAKPIPPDIPLRRKGSYQELVSLMLYLASEDAGFITGQCYLANGGAAFL